MAGFWNNLFGGSPEGLIGKADSLAAEERWPEAIEALEKALSRLPESDRAMRADLEGRIAACVDQYLRQLAEAIPRLIEEGEGEQADELLSIALSFARDDEEERRLRGSAAAPAEVVEAPAEPKTDPRPDHEIDALADSFAEALEPEEKEAVFARPVAFRRAFVLWNEGEYDRAGRALEEFLRQAPHDPYGYLFLGLTFAAAGRREEAEGVLEKAVHYEPSLVLATLSLSIVRKELGRTESAAAILAKLFEIVTEYPDRFGERRREEVIYNTVDTFLDSGDRAKAEELYTLAREHGQFAEHLPLEARMAEARGDRVTAGRKWDLFLHHAPQSSAIVGHSASRAPGPSEFERAADFFEGSGDAERAARYYEKGALLLTSQVHFGGEPIPLANLIRLRKKLAFSLIAMGNRKDAETIATEMERLRPVPPEATEIRDRLHRSLED